MRKYLAVGAGLIVAVVLIIGLIPSLRYRVSGRIAGEPIIEGQPASYWAYQVREGESTQERALAASVLGQLGTQIQGASLESLTQALSDPEPSVRKTAAQAIGKIGVTDQESIGLLLKTLNDPDGEVRAAAASAIGDLQPTDRTVISALHTLAKSEPYLPARLAAVAALGRYRARASEAIPTLIDALKEPDSPLGSPHEFSVVALKTMGPGVLPALIDALSRSEPRTRIGVLKVLGGLGTAAKTAVPTIEKRLTDEDALVQLEALNALWAIDRDAGRIVPATTKFLQTTEANPQKRSQIRAKAIYILGEVGPDARAAVPELLTILRKDPESSIRTYAARALGRMGNLPDTVAALKFAAKEDEDPDVCEAANESLQKLGPS